MNGSRNLPTRSQFVAVVSGNALEFFDFVSFSFFAVNIARVMFPADQPGTALLLTLTTGGLGFAARPMGAIVFGLLGDRIGRRPTMLMTFSLMGMSALGMALTPSHAQIGMAAPLLVVVFRLLQGLSAGGDVGPSTAFLAESAPAEHRGFLISLQMVAMRLGALSSGLVGLVLASSMSQEQLDSFGWRIAFAIGAGIVPLAFILRRRLDETLHWPETGTHVVTSISLGRYAILLVGVFGYLLPASMGDFMVVYAVTWLKIPQNHAFWITVSVTAAQVAMIMVGSLLGDRLGRRPVAITAAVTCALLAVPLFSWAATSGSVYRLASIAGLLAGITACGGSCIYPAFVESTPKRVRCALVGIGYGVVVALSFGITPVVMTQYLNATGVLSAPGYIWLAGNILVVICALLIPETAPRRLAAVAPA